jgi:hypothetical protein
MLLLRLSVLALLASTLCSCGVGQVGYAIANPDDDNANLTAAMDIMIPPLMITGDWPGITDKPPSLPSINIDQLRTQDETKYFKPVRYYAELIRTRREGEMTNKRANEVLAAMDRLFRDKKIKTMPEAEIEQMFGPPDKQMMRSWEKVDVYQFQSPRGLQERWLVR